MAYLQAKVQFFNERAAKECVSALKTIIQGDRATFSIQQVEGGHMVTIDCTEEMYTRFAQGYMKAWATAYIKYA